MYRLQLALVLFLGCLPCAGGQTAEDRKSTIAYLRALQTKSGGWLAHNHVARGRLAKPSLRATTAAVRALKYLGGQIPDRKAAQTFVRSCFAKDKGGCVDSPPGAQPEVFSTAVGIMAVVELNMEQGDRTAAAVRFMEKQAKSFEDIRIAAAGLEALHKHSKIAESWLRQVARLRNEDGSYGKGTAACRFTGGAVVTVLRLGGKVHRRAKVLETLKEGQRRDGGFGKDDAAGSDLDSCYRVVRALVMLKEKPADVKGLRKFIARCRNTDGGYGVAPGQPSNVGATYFAAILSHWLQEKPSKKDGK